METNDKERIEKWAYSFSNEFSSIHSNMPDIMKDCLRKGAEYERTIADQQLAEKDKELSVKTKIIDHWRNEANTFDLVCQKQSKEIASLKEVLRKAKYFIDDPEDMPSNREVKEFILEIENLLK